MSTVSVIIPTYRSAFLREAIQSALQQTSLPLEIIVVDSSPEVTLDQIHDCFNDVRHIPQPPRGVSQARNVGIASAKGHFIAFLDADDLWLPYKLHTQISLLDRFPEAGFCFSTTWNLVDDDNANIPRDPYFPPELQKWIGSNTQANGAVCGNAHELLLSVNCVATSSVIARKAAFDSVGVFDESLMNGEDYDLWLRIARAYPAIYVCEPTSRYRVHAGGLSGSWSRRSELFHRANVKVLEKHFADVASVAIRRALSHSLVDFADFQLKQGLFDEARAVAKRSLSLKVNGGALKTYVEATCPRFYALATRFAKMGFRD